MTYKIQALLGDCANNFQPEEIDMAYEMALAEVEAYCGREADELLRLMACKMAVIQLNRKHTEGLSSQSFSGVNESYLDGYPDEIMKVLNRKRKIKVV